MMVCPGCQSGFCQTVLAILLASGIGAFMLVGFVARLWLKKQIEKLMRKLADIVKT